ncbi:Uncharacterized protein Fot_41945 [Forsythia ovata]|uniref:Uncharacterized protein n=1 Tax=Forsythia ovata TaxID=205694 RepID=A0ABD1RJT2_9LAMI
MLPKEENLLPTIGDAIDYVWLPTTIEVDGFSCGGCNLLLGRSLFLPRDIIAYAKLQPRRSTKSASSQSHVPQQTEFEFMPTPGIIPQQLSGPDAALTGNDLQPHFSFQNMVDDLQLMENEEQSRMKANRAKNRSIVRDSGSFSCSAEDEAKLII